MLLFVVLKTTNILYIKITTAKIPRGWHSNEAFISPLKNHEIELPNPHPGQKSQPRLCKGHKL